MSVKPLSILRDAQNKQHKLLAVLFDPDDEAGQISKIAAQCTYRRVDLVLIGGSLLTRGNTESCLELVRKSYSGPVLLFPGDEIQVVPGADGILLLALLSGRNAEYLIGKHVAAAPLIHRSGLSCLPTAYLLIDGGRYTTAHYISQTLPIPADKPEIAAVTALAGVQLGMQLVYLDAGSGAEQAVSAHVIQAVCRMVDCPVFVGGGIRDEQSAQTAWNAGATVVVIGNGLMQDESLLDRLCSVKALINNQLNP